MKATAMKATPAPSSPHPGVDTRASLRTPSREPSAASNERDEVALKETLVPSNGRTRDPRPFEANAAATFSSLRKTAINELGRVPEDELCAKEELIPTAFKGTNASKDEWKKLIMMGVDSDLTKAGISDSKKWDLSHLESELSSLCDTCPNHLLYIFLGHEFVGTSIDTVAPIHVICVPEGCTAPPPFLSTKDLSGADVIRHMDEYNLTWEKGSVVMPSTFGGDFAYRESVFVLQSIDGKQPDGDFVKAKFKDVGSRGYPVTTDLKPQPHVRVLFSYELPSGGVVDPPLCEYDSSVQRVSAVVTNVCSHAMLDKTHNESVGETILDAVNARRRQLNEEMERVRCGTPLELLEQIFAVKIYPLNMDGPLPLAKSSGFFINSEAVKPVRIRNGNADGHTK